jgi:hypothetical protein
MANSTGGLLLLYMLVPQTTIAIDVATIGFVRYSDWICRANRATVTSSKMGYNRDVFVVRRANRL